MKFKDARENAHFKLTKDAEIGMDIVYIKSYQEGGRYNAVKLGTPTVPVVIQPDFDIILV